MDRFLGSIDSRLSAGWSAALARELGSLGGVLCASEDRIAAVVGDSRALHVIAALRSALIEATAANVDDRSVLAGTQQVQDYLHLRMAHRINESTRVLHLNTRNILIRDDLMAEGSIDRSAIYVREVARRALELGSAAVILVHNHPSGDPTPSNQDIATTKDLIMALKPLDVSVHDHWIVTATGQVSLRAQGYL